MTRTGLSCRVTVDGFAETIEFLTQTVRGVPYYFISHPAFTERKGIYGDTSFAPYEDNIQRYTIEDKSAFGLCEALGWKPDVIHCHDWTSGFAPYLLKLSAGSFSKKRRACLPSTISPIRVISPDWIFLRRIFRPIRESSWAQDPEHDATCLNAVWSSPTKSPPSVLRTPKRYRPNSLAVTSTACSGNGRRSSRVSSMASITKSGIPKRFPFRPSFR